MDTLLEEALVDLTGSPVPWKIMRILLAKQLHFRLSGTMVGSFIVSSSGSDARSPVRSVLAPSSDALCSQ